METKVCTKCNIEKELKHLGNKERFISEVISKKLKIMNIEEQVIISEMEKNKYDKENNTYDYLLRLQVRTLSTAIQRIEVSSEIFISLL